MKIVKECPSVLAIEYYKNSRESGTKVWHLGYSYFFPDTEMWSLRGLFEEAWT
jgi:hypothetical protein